MNRIAFLLVLFQFLPVISRAQRSVTVSPDGSGDYASISEAVASIHDAAPGNPVTVRVRPGTYRETVKTRHWVNIEGDNREACIIEYDCGSDDPARIVRTDVIKAHTNSVLKNLTIIGRRVKYSIHSDGVAKDARILQKGAYTLILENCTIVRPADAFSPAKSAGQGPFLFAVGIGLRANQHLVMKNCRIEAEQPVYLHNWGEDEPCSLTLEHSVLMTRGKVGITLQSLGGAGKDLLVLRECEFKGLGQPITYGIHSKLHPKGGAPDALVPQEIQIVGGGNQFEVPPTLAILPEPSRP